MSIVRLQKVLARAGVASRRAAEELIAAGRVRVDGRVVTELGTKVDSRQARIEVDGTRIVREQATYVVLHKPRGVVSTMRDPQGRPSIRELLADVPMRVYPVGRLDFATSGVILATNDGDFAEALMHPRRAVPKMYVVKVQGAMEPKDLDVWRRGVELEDGKTLPAKAKLLRHEGDKTWFELIITEGRNQQVRRMGEATGFRVMRLARVAFAGITAEGLRPGEWRYVTGEEQAKLKTEYGVPRRVVSPPAPEERRAVRKRSVHDDRTHDHRPPRDERTRRDERAPERAPRDDRMPRGELGGRGGRTRTTGTGGGVGAGEGSFRVRGRRG